MRLLNLVNKYKCGNHYINYNVLFQIIMIVILGYLKKIRKTEIFDKIIKLNMNFYKNLYNW